MPLSRSCIEPVSLKALTKPANHYEAKALFLRNPLDFFKKHLDRFNGLDL